MTPPLILLALAGAWIAFLLVERIQVGRHRAAIPLRIAVTGTRGKTTVTRLLAAVLREGGQTVLAKSTGSEAAYLLPDGGVRPIRRRGAPSIIEQKRLLALGADLGAQVVIGEIMSVSPECHRVEAGMILQPHMVLATNFHVDHVEAQGGTREAVASTLALAVPTGARAMVPEEEWETAFQEGVKKGGGTVTPVPREEGASRRGLSDFAQNLDLVWAAARELGVEDGAIRRGIQQAQGDLGELRAWWYGGECLVVNAFAANDPESTFRVHHRVMGLEGVSAEACTGLLSLRPDRGDRSLQWAEALCAGGLDRFSRLFVTGLHARALRHRLRGVAGWEKVELLKAGPPEAVMEAVMGGVVESGGQGLPLLFGFGNMKGLGEELVRFWEERGEPYGV